MKNIIKTLSFLLISTFLFQGFQCGSKEFTSAKTSLKRGDTLASMGYLQQELINNPSNTEAKLLLTELTYKSAVTKVPGPNGRFVDQIVSIPTLREAAKLSVDAAPETSSRNDIAFLQSLQQSIWVNSFNEGLKYFNRAESGSMNAEIDSAIALWDVGRIVRPRKLSFLNLQGNAYSKAKNSEMERTINDEYMALLLNNSREVIEQGVYYDYPADNIQGQFGSKLGTKLDTVTRGTDQDYRRTDIYKTDSLNTYIFSKQENGEYLVKGWLYKAPKLYVSSDFGWTELNTSPVELLTQEAYDKEDYTTAIEFIDKLLLFRPKDRQLNQLKVQAYVSQGKGDVAVNELNELIKNDPTKKEYNLQLGDLYSELKQYEKATKAYERAIELDPKYDYALRNLASVYKNRAVIIQESEIAKQKANEDYTPNTDEYFPLLTKSAEFFKRSSETETFGKDLGTFLELYNIYNVTGNESEKMTVLKKLESMESSIPTNKKQNYYYKMLKIYSDAKMNAQVTRISNILNVK